MKNLISLCGFGLLSLISRADTWGLFSYFYSQKADHVEWVHNGLATVENPYFSSTRRFCVLLRFVCIVIYLLSVGFPHRGAIVSLRIYEIRLE